GGHGGSLALEFVPAPDPLYSCGSTLGRGGRAGRRQPPAKRLQGQNLCPGFESRPLRHAPLAQVDRASDYESEGQRFESSRAHHQNPPRPPGVLGRLLTPPSGAFSSSIEGFARCDRALDIAILQGPARCLSCDGGDAYEQEHAATLWEICSRGSSARYFQRCLDCTTSESRTATVAATAAGQPGGHPDLPKVWVHRRRHDPCDRQCHHYRESDRQECAVQTRWWQPWRGRHQRPLRGLLGHEHGGRGAAYPDRRRP